MFTFIVIFAGILICWIAYKNDTLYFKNYLNYWYKSFDFKGNINRKDFWITQAWCLVLLIFLILISLSVFYDLGYEDGMYLHYLDCDMTGDYADCNTDEYIDMPFRYKVGDISAYFNKSIFKLENIHKNIFLLIPIYSWGIISFIPNLSIQIRRLRDAARNPLWILISFVPFIGGILLLIFYLLPGAERKQQVIDERLKKLDNFLSKGKIDEEEFKYIRKQILMKMFR